MDRKTSEKLINNLTITTQMNLMIYSENDAANHIPEIPTYAIRIFSSFTIRERIMQLQKSNSYTAIKEYTFDDIWPGLEDENLIMFNNDIANKIISDFDEKRKEVSSLLVHCSKGKNRSPAVAIALNDIFDLGNDTEELIRKYNEANWYVYRKIMKTAGKEPRQIQHILSKVSKLAF